MKLGVSSTHIDWTMIPFVRFSFMKHYILEYLKSLPDFYSLDLFGMEPEELDDWINEHKTQYLNEMNLKESDFTFDNISNLDSHFAQCALFETRKETYQAAEGMLHNLNTLQSRSGKMIA